MEKIILITGGNGFIGSHLSKKLKSLGNKVICVDIKDNEWMDVDEYCSRSIILDLRNTNKVNELFMDIKPDEVYHLAADMGGMGFIQSNHSLILYNNTMISFNCVEASRLSGVKRFFYASSACIYPEYLQSNLPSHSVDVSLREESAWPAQPQDAYGLEKLMTEELCLRYSKEHPIQFRIGRFHNIYGENGTWRGGREKSPAAFCRKAIVSSEYFEMWGDGLQTRSYCHVDDCVEGIIRLMNSDVKIPLNIGSEEMVSMNDLASLVLKLSNKNIPIKHIPGPEGVRGRNSNNDNIRKLLGWEPKIKLEDGIKRLHHWISTQISHLNEDECKKLQTSTVL